jgi:NADH pyrophosphatase NudC (nudix superfamily)
MFKEEESKWKQRTCKNDHLFFDFSQKYKYCPTCGEPIIFKERIGKTLTCDHCKKEISDFGAPKYCYYCGTKGDG